MTAIGVIVAWAVTGPMFRYFDTWQLFINTGTTIVTFLMVFLIQNTQNRDARAIHLKLNELIHAVDKAKNRMIDVEKLSDLELEELAKTYEGIRISAQEQQTRRTDVAVDTASTITGSRALEKSATRVVNCNFHGDVKPVEKELFWH